MRYLMYFFVLPLFFLSAVPVFADMAPIQAVSGNLAQIKESPIVMDSETVSFAIDEQGEMKQAIATFWMKNPTDKDIVTTSTFPVSYFARDEITYAHPESIRVIMNGSDVRGVLMEGVNIPIDDSMGLNRATSTGYVFPLSIPAHQTVKVEVRFNPALSTDTHSPYLIFKYVLATGAGWSGSIHSAIITVNYPYPLEDGWIFASASGTTRGKTAEYRFVDLNPTPKDDIEFRILPPSIAKTIIEQKAAIQTNPEDPDRYRALAETYRSMNDTDSYWRYALQSMELRYGSTTEPATGKGVLELARLYSDDWVFMDNGVVSNIDAFMNLMDYARRHEWKESDIPALTELHAQLKKNAYGYGYLHPEDYDFLPGADATSDDVVVGNPSHPVAPKVSFPSNLNAFIPAVAAACAVIVAILTAFVFFKRK